MDKECGWGQGHAFNHFESTSNLEPVTDDARWPEPYTAVALHIAWKVHTETPLPPAVYGQEQSLFRACAFEGLLKHSRRRLLFGCKCGRCCPPSSVPMAYMRNLRILQPVTVAIRRARRLPFSRSRHRVFGPADGHSGPGICAMNADQLNGACHAP